MPLTPSMVRARLAASSPSPEKVIALSSATPEKARSDPRTCTPNASQAKITIVGVPDEPGAAGRIFETVAQAEINIDMIVQNVSTEGTGRTDISFTLPKADGPTAMSALNKIQEQIKFKGLLFDDHVGKVSLIGAGMRSHPGVAASFFACIGEAGVNIEMISTSEIRITTIIAEDALETAVRALHTAFELERPESAAAEPSAAAG